jgi:AraC family transcriptional regulator of arabinose operon
VIAFINRLRIREAARLLEAESMSVKEVAAAVGYSSPFYFSRQFRRFYFIDPTGFRRHAAAMRPEPERRR